MSLALALAPGIDIEAHARVFAAAGHTRIAPFLKADVAARLAETLRQRPDWRQMINSGDKVFELDRAARAAMTADQQTALDTAVRAGAREGFQFRYEAIRLADGNGAPVGRDMLADWTHWLSAGPVRDLFRAITGAADIGYADGQATAYAPGDFLTGHDDAVPGKGRRAAYVLGLTPVWRIEWGGLLLFHTGDRVHGMMPGYNCLDLFAVPQLHSVSEVTAAAAFRRHAITGWLRT